MRKRLLFVLALMAFGLTGAWADELTGKQALELAQQFVASHNLRKSMPTVKEAGQVSGLYVFNVSNDGGFVIVSNDDQTVSILGFGQSGNIDINDLPDNMRAWLEGYADQIAWLQRNGNDGANGTNGTRRTNRTAKTAVGPLITTNWNQNAPYNNLCPEYETGKRCATGCVATAYAQVMYYTEMVTHNNTITTTTAEIPSYTTRNKNHTLSAIPAGTSINWSAMTAVYNGNSTSEAKDAVANMMLICGCAVEMNYGQESGAYTKDVATALKSYFGYAETTQFVNRSCYTYDNWIDLIYNELYHGRPVVYGGQGTDVGHEFVCDGYMYDNGDLFHINWGWGGMSDGYFVLSVLNPDEQGIGGSPSSSAFTLGQEAVIGIQKTGDIGTVLDVPTTMPIDLTINSVTLSHSTIALGESVDVTINVTNNSTTNVYDGEIYLSGLRGGKMFEIPAEGTQDCVITVTPTAAKSYTVKASYYTGTTTTATSSCSASLNVKNQTPTSVTVSNVDSESATIGWTNVGEATKWNLRSMPVAFITEDFNGPGNGWGLTRSSKDDTNGISGSPCVKFEKNGSNQWLVSPQITFGGIFSFYAWKSGETAESFSVLYSKDSHTFTYIKRDVEATTTPTEYTINVGDLSGNGWLAIIHFGGTEGSCLYVDDATIVEPAGDWTMVSNLTANSYSLTGLTATPRYEVQVQAVNNNGGNWSNPFVFATSKNTLALLNKDNEAATKNVELLKQWDGMVANVTLSDRTLYRDDHWNTLCLPFDVNSFTGTPLEGATVLALDVEHKWISNNGQWAIDNENGDHQTGFDASTGTLDLFFNEVNEIEAGTPYLIKWASASDISNPSFFDVTIENGVHDVEFPGGWLKGSYNSQTFADDNKRILFLGADNKLYWPQPGATIGAQRAYFQIADDVNVKAFNLNFGDSSELTTGIGLTPDPSPDGEGSDYWYSLDGRKLNGKPSCAGVYIYKGKKVAIK